MSENREGENAMRNRLFSLTVLVLLAGTAAWCATKVTPLDSLTMVNPLTGEGVSGIGGSAGKGWQTANPVWDGKQISLSGAKGERLAFQLVFLWAEGDSIQGIEIIPEVKGAQDIRTSRSWCIWNTPEIGVPLEGTKYSFDIPSKVPIETEFFANNKYVAWSAWVELTIPRSVTARTLNGTVRVTAGSGLKATTFPITISVFPFSLPSRPQMIIEMNSYGDYTRHLGSGIVPYMSIHKLMRRYRCTFVEVPYNQSGNTHGHITPQLDRKTGAINWDSFDKNVGGLFDGTAFEDGQPVSHFILPLNYQWPAQFRMYKTNPAEYAKINIEVRKAIIAHIKEKGWSRTIFQEFHNENPSNGAKLPWHLDEPRSARDMKGHQVFTGYHAKAVEGAPEEVRYNYRLDVSNWQRVRKAMETVAPRIQDWVVSRDRKYLDAKSAIRFRKYADAGKGLFLEYGEVTGFNSGQKPANWSIFTRYAKACWMHRSDGYEQWMIDMWKRKADKTPLSYSNAAGARDLIWPGKHFGINGPLPSLRLKAIRESTYFFDYARLATGKDAAKTDALVKSMNTDEAKTYWETKARLASLIAAQ